jgi:hypothetical protein
MRFPLLLASTLLFACSSNTRGLTAADAGVGPGPAPTADPGGKPKPDAAAPAGKGKAATTSTVPVVGIPVPGSQATPIAGGGPAGATPLMPGCTPASADECPSVAGTCATAAGANPKVVEFGVLCLFGGTYTVAGKPAALLEYLRETAGGQDYYRLRLTFSTTFVDNTYGANAIGWGDKGHTFKDLVGSDHAEMKLFDGHFALVSQFKLDYISADTSATCGYRALGVRGGEGKMIVGDAQHILGASTSFSRALAGCGYCSSPACDGDCTVNSPKTDALYTPNPATPNWDYRVQYEVWVDAAAFGANGFGGVSVDYVHASPSKDAGGNTITVVPRACTPDGCAPGTVEYLTAEGAVGCKPGDPNGDCPSDYEKQLTSEGAVCLPVTVPRTSTSTSTATSTSTTTTKDAGTGCVPGTVEYLTAEGAPRCVPVPGDKTPCGPGTTAYVATEGRVCLPVPTDGTCPKGYVLDPTGEGTVCI